MTRIVSYNILAGGYNVNAHNKSNMTHRLQQLTQIIRSTQADVVGLVEAINPRITQRPFVVEELAETLGMELVISTGVSRNSNNYLPALMTRLPIIYKKVHTHPGLLTRPVLEVCMEEAGGEQFVVFVTHLTAAFSKGWGGNAIRQREVREILRLAEQVKHMPHVIMGDFNSLAPGDVFKASFLLRYIVMLDRKRLKQLKQGNEYVFDGHPYLDTVVPKQLRLLKPLLRVIPGSKFLSTLFDLAAYLYAPRGSVALLQEAGYIDCYRRIHPRAWGLSCPAIAPAGRIDYIFANPHMAQLLETCYTVLDGNGLPGSEASDHLAVAAEFGIPIGVEYTTPFNDMVTQKVFQ